MILSMSGQAWLFLSTVAAGFVIGFVYDIFRILRKTVPHRGWAVQMEDIIYWVTVSILMFYFMLNRNYGEIRFFSIAGSALGMIIYFNSLSRLILTVSVAVIKFLQKVFLTAAKILLGPVRLLVRIFAPPIRKLLRCIRGAVRGGLRRLRHNVFVILKKV